jgi:DNA-binding transcriptional MerR regulator
MRVGQVAKMTGVPAKTVRYYEEVGVLPPPRRTPAGYRQYGDHAVHQLMFIRRARALGLSLRDVRALTAALDGGSPAEIRPRLREVVREHLRTVQRQISELRLLRLQLERVLRGLQGPTRRRPAGPCRCLDVAEPPAHAGARARSATRQTHRR